MLAWHHWEKSHAQKCSGTANCGVPNLSWCYMIIAVLQMYCIFLESIYCCFEHWFCEIFLVGFFWANCTILQLFVWRFLWWHFTPWNWTALILELFRTMVCVVNFISEVFFNYLTFRIRGKKYFPPSMFGIVHNSPPYLWN